MTKTNREFQNIGEISPWPLSSGGTGIPDNLVVGASLCCRASGDVFISRISATKDTVSLVLSCGSVDVAHVTAERGAPGPRAVVPISELCSGTITFGSAVDSGDLSGLRMDTTSGATFEPETVVSCGPQPVVSMGIPGNRIRTGDVVVETNGLGTVARRDVSWEHQPQKKMVFSGLAIAVSPQEQFLAEGEPERPGGGGSRGGVAITSINGLRGIGDQKVIDIVIHESLISGVSENGDPILDHDSPPPGGCDKKRWRPDTNGRLPPADFDAPPWTPYPENPSPGGADPDIPVLSGDVPLLTPPPSLPEPP